MAKLRTAKYRGEELTCPRCDKILEIHSPRANDFEDHRKEGCSTVQVKCPDRCVYSYKEMQKRLREVEERTKDWDNE